jgi:K+-transporting ATPase ATPase A chain
MFTPNDFYQIIFYVVSLVVLSPILGNYFASVFLNKKNLLSPVLGNVEKTIFRICKIDPGKEMDWKIYTFNLLTFNFFGIILLVLLQEFQNLLPLNPQKFPGVELSLAVNTAVSFVTNTNWQSYAGETTMSYLVQMAGLAVQNFVSAATGIAVFLAFTRGFITKQGNNIGNFWDDLIKSILYVLLPLSIILSVVLVAQGAVQTFSPYVKVNSLEGGKQTIPLGPAASQIAIKQLGTNGGGFFNTNSAFPFENPTPLTNFLEMLSILLIPGSLVFTYGKIINSRKQAWMIFTVMLLLFMAGLLVSAKSEFSYNPVMHAGRIMEGKEVRFGPVNSVIWSTATTDASNGSVNSMHDSLSPLAGMIAMLNIMLGEIIFGGVGAGMYGMIIFILLTVFISGLMVGRTPEYLGKKIESPEIKWTIAAVLLPSAVILLFSAIALITKDGLAGILNKGPHGFSEILYAFSSAAGNNGSAFAGLNSNTTFYNLMMTAGMLAGRYGVIIPCLAIAGNLVKKNITPVSSGTLATDNLMFAFMLVSVIIIVGALTFFPALSLGPLIEHLLMKAGISF